VLAGPEALPAEARAALATWQPRAPHHALDLGLRLARELARGTGRLMIVSDTNAAGHDLSNVSNAMWVALGQPTANVGIIAAERTVSPGEGQGAALLTLGNYSDVAQTRRVRITAGEKEVAATQVTAPPGASTVRLPLAAGLPTVHVSLADDALMRDNDVVLVEPRPNLVAVENRLPAGRGHDALDRAVAALSNVTRSQSGQLQFIDADALDTAAPAGVWRAAFGHPPARLLTEGPSQDFIGPFIIEKRNPLLSGVRLFGVYWTGAWPLAAAAGRPLASVDTHPIVTDLGGSGDGQTVLFNIDLERTNLIRATDWPILVSNLVELRRQGLPGPERWNYRVGEWIRVRLGRDPKGPLRMRVDGRERALPAGRTIELVAPASGGLLEIFEGQERLFEIGVNFLDEAESDLRGSLSAVTGAFVQNEAAVRGESGAWSDPLFWILLVTAAGAIMVNWCVPALDRRSLSAKAALERRIA
jgi:hypothetical protein